MTKGLLVKQARNKLGLTQAELGKKMVVGLQEVSKWERNIVELPDARIFELRYIYDMEIRNIEETDLLFKPWVDSIMEARK